MAALFIDDETNSDWIKYGERERVKRKLVIESGQAKIVDPARPSFSPVCTFCKHWLRGFSCEAFDSIPAEIWLGENDHSEPFEGDDGVQFERAT